jgi:hypothetical protein
MRRPGLSSVTCGTCFAAGYEAIAGSRSSLTATRAGSAATAGNRYLRGNTWSAYTTPINRTSPRRAAEPEAYRVCRRARPPGRPDGKPQPSTAATSAGRSPATGYQPGDRSAPERGGNRRDAAALTHWREHRRSAHASALTAAQTSRVGFNSGDPHKAGRTYDPGADHPRC